MRGFSSPSRAAGTSAVCRICTLSGGNVRSRSPMAKAIHLASNERRTPVRLRFRNWRKAERTMLIRRKAYQSHSKRCRRPGRLAFRTWRSGEVSIPARCRAAGFQNPPPSRRRPLRIEIGVPSEIRTPYLPHRRRMLCSSELRELILVRARGIEPAPSTVICRSGLIRPSRTPVLARKSVRRVIGQGGVIRTRDLMRPRHALLPG